MGAGLLLAGFSYQAAAQTGSFAPSGSMGSARSFQTATLLSDGRLLVAGGFNAGVVSAYSSAELYNPATGSFSATGSLGTARRAHAATLLRNGKVLITGGRLPPAYFASSELYDPATGTFSATGSMATPRAFFTATLLPTGKVLVTGGLNAGVYLASAELYDPNTGFFSPTGSLAAARVNHTATLLPDGRVLISGGDIGATVLASAELYDPDTGLFTAAGNMITARSLHTATLLPTSVARPRGKVLIAGGDSNGAGGPPAFASAELFDPATGLFTATGSMNVGREYHTAIFLPSYEYHPHGKVLVAGGDNGAFTLAGMIASVELYDPDSGKFTTTAPLTSARENNTITLLPAGGVLLTGGTNSKTAFASTELYALPPTYTITDLGTLGGTFSSASYMNNNGLIGGASLTNDGNQHATLWRKGQIGDIGVPGLGGANSEVYGLSEIGQAVGAAELSTPDPMGQDFCGFLSGKVCLPFLWQDGLMNALSTLGGRNGVAVSVNNLGEAVGAAETATLDATCFKPQQHQYQAVVWGPKPGQVRQLPPLKGDTVAAALWNNDGGQVVGQSGVCGNMVLPPLALGPHAVLWEKDGSVTDLGNLGGTVNPNAPVAGNTALYINNQGQVAGFAALPGDATYHAFVWTKEGGMKDQGTLPGDLNSLALGLSEKGEVVGMSSDSTGNSRAFLVQNGTMLDLNALVPGKSPLFLMGAFAITSRGEIAGLGMASNGDIHAYVATPTSGSDVPGTPMALVRELTGQGTLPEGIRKAMQQGLRFTKNGRRVIR